MRTKSTFPTSAPAASITCMPSSTWPIGPSLKLSESCMPVGIAGLGPPTTGMMGWKTRTLPQAYDLLAPDGSEIRIVGQLGGGSMVQCVLRPGDVTRAVRHKTVEEIWLCVGGSGELWRADDAG